MFVQASRISNYLRFKNKKQFNTLENSKIGKYFLTEFPIELHVHLDCQKIRHSEYNAAQLAKGLHKE